MAPIGLLQESRGPEKESDLTWKNTIWKLQTCRLRLLPVPQAKAEL